MRLRILGRFEQNNDVQILPVNTNTLKIENFKINKLNMMMNINKLKY